MDGFDFAVEVVRSNRKRTVSIQFKNEGVVVRVPKTLSTACIRELITRKTRLILKKLEEISVATPVLAKKMVCGEAMPYLGKNFQLRIIPGIRSHVVLEGDYLNVITDAKTTDVKLLIISWYKEHALCHLLGSVQKYANIIGVSPTCIKVKHYKARWGSCSLKGEVYFNWQIILAPHDVIDYVIVHELCHIIEHNHSPRFWKLVEKYIPDYLERKYWLRIHGCELMVFSYC